MLVVTFPYRRFGVAWEKVIASKLAPTGVGCCRKYRDHTATLVGASLLAMAIFNSPHEANPLPLTITAFISM
ncbi:hypothetical protein C1C98_02595 [Pseudomonas ogarae]|uniref:Uncharacterized protein n=1 Tax=Pseudomonas ogarae (strain DSM 112162 / CECT 30235 / F113) TaxID=1114970 RepID=A0ABN5G2K4_PSEO1|nr:hypothetical protein C1C98_02595 [Pseudomonas ogarae]